MELVADCPYATQDMVDAALSRIKSYEYQMFSADEASIDPAAELGDGVTIDGVYGVLSRINDDGSGYPDISSPGEAELEDEYPVNDGPMTQSFNRQIAQTRSSITKTAEQIRAEVANEVEGLSSSISVTLDGITERVEGLSGQYTELKTTLDGVTITDESGTTHIRGSSIETNSIAAKSIRADQIQLEGSITFSDLDADTQAAVNDRGISESYAHTLIERDLVASPNIAGGKFWDSSRVTRMELSMFPGSGIPGFMVGSVGADGEYQDYMMYILRNYAGNVDFFLGGALVMNVDGSSGAAQIKAYGQWDFSDAAIIGL